MKRVYRRRLIKLAKFLEVLDPKKFDFTKYTCGSTACAVGWCPAVFPEDWVRVGDKKDGNPRLLGREHCLTTRDSAEVFFGLSPSEFNVLFLPRSFATLPHVDELNTSMSMLCGDAKPKQVAKQIRVFVATKELHEARAIKV